MKTNLIRTLLSTAALLSLSAAAYAQNYLGANIPFSFRMNGNTLPAGTYRLGHSTTNTSDVLYLRGYKDSAFAMGLPSTGKDKRARLVFHCGETSGCALAEVWNDEGRGWRLPAPRPSAAEKERLAVVYMDRKNAAD